MITARWVSPPLVADFLTGSLSGAVFACRGMLHLVFAFRVSPQMGLNCQTFAGSIPGGEHEGR